MRCSRWVNNWKRLDNPPVSHGLAVVPVEALIYMDSDLPDVT